MEKTFVNVLAYSRLLRLVIIFALAFVVTVDVIVITLVIKVVGYASLEERTKIIRLVILLLLSSAAGFSLFYLIHGSLRNQWIRTDDTGITYNSWAKKISASWDEVTSVSVVPPGRYQALRIETKKGKFYA